MVEGFCYDTETDGFVFQSKQLWVIWLKDLNDPNKKLKLEPFKDSSAKQKFIEFVSSYEGRPHVVAHNQLGYDVFILKHLLGLEFEVGKRNGDTIENIPVQFVDTYYWSMFLYPDRLGHSIEYFGDVLGLPKIDFRQASVDAGIISKDSPEGEEFQQYSHTMVDYCERDVDVNIKVFKYLYEEHQRLYGQGKEIATQAFKCGQKSFFLMSCQEYAGFKFDIEKAQALKIRIADMMEEIRAEVEPLLPPRGLKKSEEKEYTMPAKPFKKDGTLSSTMLKWIEKHNAKLVGETQIEAYGKVYEISGGVMLDVTMPMEMANQQQIKDWLLSQGWEPTLFNFKRGPDGKPMRDPVTRQLIPTTPKMQEAGKLCPNLEALEGDLVKKIVKWLSLRNRQSVLEGWMSDPRLGYDGRLSGRRSGVTNTHRQKHAVICNVPKADDKVLLGKEFRDLFTCEDGMILSAADASGIEARVQGHYVWKYDSGETATVLLEKDVHSQTVKGVWSDDPYVASVDISAPDFDKEHPKWKPYRNKAKGILYGILYGAGAAKVASMVGVHENKGNVILERFWNANLGTKKLKDALERYWETTGKKKYLPAIDGRILHTRKKSALLNTIFQSCGGIIMDYACCFMDMWLGKIYFDEKRRPYYLYKGKEVKRVIYYHDEYSFECHPEIADGVGELLEKAIVKAGELLKIRVPLAGEYKVGNSWKSVH